jgi:conjugative relaxase-like TrwC/TraI family protein
VICSVTALSAKPSDVATAVGNIIAYLQGRPQVAAARGGVSGGVDPALEFGVSGDYYADSARGSGIWVGSGIGSLSLTGEVATQDLCSLLLGDDPTTGAALLSGQGSAGRAERDREGTMVPIDPTKTYSTVEAARVLGVTKQAVGQQLGAGAKWMEQHPDQTPPDDVLVGAKTGPKQSWEIDGAVLAKFAASRTEADVVLGFDVTWSAPKSLSSIWALGDDDTRKTVESIVIESVRAGMDYLEQEGLQVRVKGQSVTANGVLGAAFLHTTSRALDPQLHVHVTTANAATAGDDPQAKALHGQALFHHAKSAGFVAAAELRRLTVEAFPGVQFEEVANGVAELVGFAEVNHQFSKRSDELAEELAAVMGGVRTARSAQMAAWQSRAAKQTGVDEKALFAVWAGEGAEHGWDTKRISATLHADRRHQQAVALRALKKEGAGATLRAVALGTGELSPREEAIVFASIAGPAGVTEHENRFDRRNAVTWIAEQLGHRVGAVGVRRLADHFVASPHVLALEAGAGKDGVFVGDRRSSAAGGEHHRQLGVGPSGASGLDGWAGLQFTTVGIVAAEERAMASYVSGASTDVAVVPQALLDMEIAKRPTLGDDQRAGLQMITQSGDRVGIMAGLAGSGKTFALEAAARAWESAGYEVLASAVASRHAWRLGTDIATPNLNVAQVLLSFATGATVFDNPAKGVLLIDEASMVGTRDLARLFSYGEELGFALRLVGDPQQHDAVTAGAMFSALIDSDPGRVATLTVNRRQSHDEPERHAAMSVVREALAEFRDGDLDKSLDRLHADGRIVFGETPQQLLAMIADDWYTDRILSSAGERRPSAMMAEHHHERGVLNALARKRLRADGTLQTPDCNFGGVALAVGDHVITRRQYRNVTVEGASTKKQFVKNGWTGVVTNADEQGVRVDFGVHGAARFSGEEIARKTKGVIGSLTPAYALTSHAAEGDTMGAGRGLWGAKTRREAAYVTLTRGTDDVKLYTLNPQPKRAPEEAHELGNIRALTKRHDEEPDFDQLRDRLAAQQLPRPVTADDRGLIDPNERAAKHAQRTSARSVVDTILHPPSFITETFGARPPTPEARRAWDGAVATVLEQNPTLTTYSNGTLDASTLLGPRPHGEAGQWDLAAERLTNAAATLLVADGTRAVSQAPSNTDWSAQIRNRAVAVMAARHVEQQPPYLTELLGPRPKPTRRNPEPAGRWQGISEAIESYRIAVEAIAPTHGPVVPGHDDALVAALGPRPDDPVAADLWDAIGYAVDPTRPVPNEPLDLPGNDNPHNVRYVRNVRNVPDLGNDRDDERGDARKGKIVDDELVSGKANPAFEFDDPNNDPWFLPPR